MPEALDRYLRDPERLTHLPLRDESGASFELMKVVDVDPEST